MQSPSLRTSGEAMRSTTLFVALMMALPATASAQDTTPPVLLDSKISPVAFA